ncbi:hypothetical protein [Nocardia asiatica]|uniref:hypothetical protein n=1 Tax=Nocardia asiatica TaxID=209252 RepID=UPI002457D943|nr:hypothetical protein [Nocardia asiatica]
MTKAELRQRDLDQENPAFLAWVSRMDAEIERFFAEDAPEVAALEDPWTREGLRLAVLAARRAFPEPRESRLVERSARAERFVRYIGELYLHRFGGRWANVPTNATREVEFYPVAQCPVPIGYLEPEPQFIGSFVTQISKRVPAHPDGEPVWVLDNMTRNWERWIEVGRPDYDEWQQIKFQDLLNGRV